MSVKSDQALGWTRRRAAVSVLVVLEEHRKAMGRRVVQLREGKGWSQETLAYHAKVSAKTISRMENGERETRRHIIRQVADALSVNEVDLVGEPPAPLGLGAREEQVNNGFAEFRQHVDDIRTDLAELKAMLQEAQTEREAIRQLLATQEQILEEMRRVAAGLPDDETLKTWNAGAQQLAAAAEAGQAARAASSSTPAGTHRRRATDR